MPLCILLSEHVLCKESIVIAKKFDFEILTYLYVLRSREFIYAIFFLLRYAENLEKKFNVKVNHFLDTFYKMY